MSPVVLISLASLIFAVGSFWWLNERPSRLEISRIRAFAAYATLERAALRIPIAISNPGPKSVVIADLRVAVISAGLSAMGPSATFRKSLKPVDADVEDFPHPYVIPARSSVTKFVEFSLPPSVMTTGSLLEVTVFALRRMRWRRIGRLTVRTDGIGDPGAYITYSNDPALWPAGHAARAERELRELRERLKTLNHT